MKKLLDSIDRARDGALVRSFAGLEATAKWLLTVASWLLVVVAFETIVHGTPSMTGWGTRIPTVAAFVLLTYVLMSIMKVVAWGADMVIPAWRRLVSAMSPGMQELTALLILVVAVPLSAWGMEESYGKFSYVVLDLIQQMSGTTSCPAKPAA